MFLGSLIRPMGEGDDSSLYFVFVQSCPTLCDSMDRSMPGLPVPHHLLQFAQVHAHCIREAIQLSHPLLPSSPDLSLSQHQCLFPMNQFFSSDDQNSEVSASPSVFPDWLVWSPCSAVTFRSLLQHRSSKASILWCSTFLMVQLSQLYVTTGKGTALARQTFVSRVMPLLFNILSRLVIAFLRSNHLISWLRHHPQWFWSPRRNMSLLPHFSPLFF